MLQCSQRLIVLTVQLIDWPDPKPVARLVKAKAPGLLSLLRKR